MIKKIDLIGVVSLIVAILGIIISILWSHYQSKSSITIETISQRLIVNQSNKFENIEVTYKNKKIENLSQTIIRIENNGSLPVSNDDIIEPITLSFKKPESIIDISLSKKIPDNISVDLKKDEKLKFISLNFNLLNSGDIVDISVLNSSDKTRYTASARIKGVKGIEVDDRYPKQGEGSDAYIKGQKAAQGLFESGKWLTWLFVLGVVFLCSLAINLHQFSKEYTIKNKIKDGTYRIPKSNLRSDLLVEIKKEFSFLPGSNNLIPLTIYLEELPSSDNFSEVYEERIIKKIRELLDRADSNLGNLLFTLIISFIIFSVYFYYNFFQ